MDPGRNPGCRPKRSGPSGARDVSDFSTGTVRLRLGEDCRAPCTHGRRRAIGPAVRRPERRSKAAGPSRLDRSSVLPCWVIRSAASGPDGALEVCGGACEGSRATRCPAGAAIRPAGLRPAPSSRRRGSPLFGAAAFSATLAQSILSAIEGGGLRGFGRFLGGLGHGGGSGRLRSWATAVRLPFAGPWPGPRAAWLLRSWRRPGGGCPTARWVRGPAHAEGRDLDIGNTRHFGHRRGTIHVPRLQLGGRRGLVVNRRGNHFLKGLFGLLLRRPGPNGSRAAAVRRRIPAWHRGQRLASSIRPSCS